MWKHIERVLTITLAFVSIFFGFLFLCIGYFCQKDSLCPVPCWSVFEISEGQLVYLSSRPEALFALAGFLFMYLALMTQRDTLKTQQDALEEQKKESERQAKILSGQLFSQKFQSLMNGYDNALRRIEMVGQDTVQGRWQSTLDNIADQIIVYQVSLPDFVQRCAPLQHVAWQYVESILNVFETIDSEENRLTEQEQQFYSSLFKSKLAVSELIFLYHVPQFTTKLEKYQRLVNRFSVLENLFNFTTTRDMFSQDNWNNLQNIEQWF